ncbi:MAG TPA: histidine kinase [Solirubrobacteraceae bacterium]|nr:histidine kinase [Solirubrobacteraceae bacterium]
MVGSFFNWFRRGYPGSRGSSLLETAASTEAMVLRVIAVLVLTAFVAKTCTTAPHPGLEGRSAGVLAAFVAFVVLVVAIVAVFAASAASSVGATSSAGATRPAGAAHPAGSANRATGWRARLGGPQPRLIFLLIGLSAASAALAALQPEGSWELGPALVACFAAIGLTRRAAVGTFALAAVALLAVGGIQGDDGRVASALIFTALPWFVVFRLLREVRIQRDALEASRLAEARAAAAAERGWLVREMHDVLAHSLSALALKLETTRLLARDRGVDGEVARAVDDAHGLAASGLQEARQAIATARGDEVPGPERIGLLVESFGEQSRLPATLEVRGAPQALAPEARLALYRTAQEALTNIRRHATAERVEVKLDYLPGRTVLVVEDHAAAETPPPAAVGVTGGTDMTGGTDVTNGGYGLTGMRERAELLGGRLLAGPTADGFRVELWLPRQPPAAAGTSMPSAGARRSTPRSTHRSRRGDETGALPTSAGTREDGR